MTWSRVVARVLVGVAACLVWDGRANAQRPAYSLPTMNVPLSDDAATIIFASKTIAISATTQLAITTTRRTRPLNRDGQETEAPTVRRNQTSRRTHRALTGGVKTE
jgi:hypothetical protein